VNNRIVVVGASDTGISLIESLISIKSLNFTNLTLLAPGGLITMNSTSQFDMIKPASTNYSMRELKNLMLEARVTVMDAKMIKSDKQSKKIHLDKNALLSYDILVSTVGLIDTELQSRNIISNGLFKTTN
jgi:NADH dehydrogenase FAD-containing subunit